MSVLFKNARILATVNGFFKVLDGAFLGVSGKKINYIGTSRPSFPYDSEKDMHDRLLMPGLVNGHAHSAMNLLKGMGSDLPLQDWLNTIWPVEGRMREQELVSGMEMVVLEMLAGGTTSFSDMYLKPMVTQKVIGESGIKA
ncbi:MAG: amidohydrolase family protein, partial [Spirochaetales bacterium]|nr:amidohydrolase family protein [Spirochaetales bacterium]